MRRNILQRAAPLAEMPALDNHLCFALYAAGNHMTRLFVPFLRKLGVTYPQYLVLVVLWERGSQGVGDLASALGMDFGTLSPMLKRLERKGLVARRRYLADERRVVVSLTPKGQSLLKDRLHRFVRTAGPTESRTASRGELEPA
jgi:DNA-binding MarR family transcriptional regulator